MSKHERANVKESVLGIFPRSSADGFQTHGRVFRVRAPFNLLYKPVPSFDLFVENTALIIMDVQHLTVDKKGGVASLAWERGVLGEFKEYCDLVETMISNIHLILAHNKM